MLRNNLLQNISKSGSSLEHQQNIALRTNPNTSQASEPVVIYIDTAHCNLRCKMCPRGNIHGIANSACGFMNVDMFRKIANKILNENIIVNEFAIGNWGEATLNPDLWRITYLVQHLLHPKNILINTNLTLPIVEPEKLLLSGVSEIRVSISGMTQKIYEKNHVGGNIEKVLSNLIMLKKLKDELGIDFPNLSLVFHEYIYNKEDKALAAAFCQNNRLQFMPIRCYVCCVEEGVKFYTDESVRSFYRNFIDVDDEISKMRTIPPNEPCKLTNQLVINFDGSVYKCCGTYGEQNLLGNFFDWSISDLLKANPMICQMCKNTLLSWR